MSLKYNTQHKIKFTWISERFDIPKQFKGKQCQMHGSLINYVIPTFRNTRKYKQQVVDAINLITYSLINNEPISFNWSTKDPFETMPEIDRDVIRDGVGELYLTIDSIEWDLTPVEDSVQPPENVSYDRNSTQISRSVDASVSTVVPTMKLTSTVNASKEVCLTDKQDLYIKAPTYPQFDCNRPWLSMQDGTDKLVIYTTLPDIPTKQNEISVTTDINKMTDSEIMNLYPKNLIRTRAPEMYDQIIPEIKYDDDMGMLLPVKGFTSEQMLDNIIRYPHLYKLQRQVDGELRSFYSDIEIDGQLYPILDIWGDLPESQIIPGKKEFIKEYVVRRYLLERDDGVVHKYPMYGRLDEFLTLFMPSDSYIARGYEHVLDISKQCVKSRVLFKQSRNPVLRRLGIYND